MSEATLAPHAVSLQEAADRASLEHLAAAYGHAIDRRDYALLRSLYHDDAIDDHAPYFTGPADAFIAWLPQMMASWAATAHIIMSRLYLIDGYAAEGELAVLAYHRTLDGTREFIAMAAIWIAMKNGQGYGGSPTASWCWTGMMTARPPGATNSARPVRREAGPAQMIHATNFSLACESTESPAHKAELPVAT